MAKNKSDMRVVVNVNDKPRYLFSVTERKGGSNDGDLVIKLKAGGFYREMGHGASSNIEIKSQRYSIHCSRQSETKINKIQHTLELENGVIRTEHYTKAIKHFNQFAGLFIKRCPDLSAPKYVAFNRNEGVLVLDDYNPKTSTLYYMVIIGPKGGNIDIDLVIDINRHSIQFREFSLTIFWCYGMVPSYEHGALGHMRTIDPEKIPKGLENIQEVENGWTAEEAILTFHQLCLQAQHEHVHIISKAIPELANSTHILGSLGFFKHSYEKRPIRFY
jgi:hypothetical protein